MSNNLHNTKIKRLNCPFQNCQRLENRLLSSYREIVAQTHVNYNALSRPVPKVADDVISGQACKTHRAYPHVNFEVAGQ